MTTLRDTILDAALREAVFDGFTPGAMTRGAQAAGLTPFDARRAFPSGVSEMLDYFSQRTDTEMLRILGKDYHLPGMKIRERIATAVMVRLRVLTPHREAMRRLAGHYALPWHVPAGLKHLYATVDAMWAAAGDTSTDYNFYTKRLLLAKVYTSTIAVWLNDHSSDAADTQAFLYRRIENVMQIEKFKAKAKEAWTHCEEWLPRRRNAG